MSNSLVWAIAKKIEWFCLRQCWDRKTFCLGCKLVEDVLPVPGAIGRFQYRADSRFALSQWETSLQSNAVSHWLCANLKSALALHLTQNSYLDIHKAKKQILRSGIRIISSLWSYIRVLGIAPQRAYRVITTNVTASFLHLSNAVTSFWRKIIFFCYAMRQSIVFFRGKRLQYLTQWGLNKSPIFYWRFFRMRFPECNLYEFPWRFNRKSLLLITVTSQWAWWCLKQPASRLFTLTVYSGGDQRKHQSSTSLAFVWGIHWWPVNSPHKWPVTRKMFPFDDVIMLRVQLHNKCSLVDVRHQDTTWGPFY